LSPSLYCENRPIYPKDIQVFRLVRILLIAVLVTVTGFALAPAVPASAATSSTPGTNIGFVAGQTPSDSAGNLTLNLGHHTAAVQPTTQERALASEMAALVNSERTARGLPALVVSSNLSNEEWAWLDAERSYGSMTPHWAAPDGSGRLPAHTTAEYELETLSYQSVPSNGENAFDGWSLASTGWMVKSWMQSAGHYLPIVSKSTVLGVAVVCRADGTMNALINVGWRSVPEALSFTDGRPASWVDASPNVALTTSATSGSTCSKTVVTPPTTTPTTPTTTPTTPPVTTTSSGVTFVSLPAPVRAADTRSGGPITNLTVNVSPFGVPADATGVALNVTATAPSAGGFVSVYSCDAGWSGASSLNFTAGQTVANFAPSALGGSRSVCLRSSVSTHLIVDVIGYWTSKSAFVNAAGRRGDSRSSGVLNAGSVFRVDGFSTNSAHIVNVTGVSVRGSQGFLDVYDCAASSTGTSALNFAPGEARAASFPVLTPSGSLCVSTSGGGDVIVDEVAAFASSEYSALSGRLFDSRSSGGPGRIFEVATGNTGSVAITVTAVASAAPSFATVWPCGQAMPTASTLNHPGGAAAVANTTVVTGGRACVFLSSPAQVIVDRLGNF
jgi:hypothetical protein